MAMPPRSSRLRSLGGCLTCRKRHVKCDETRPSCRLCSHYGLTCGGYKAKIAFDTDDVDPDTLRRPLYTTQEQVSMTTALTSSAPLASLHKLLLLLDESTPNTEVISSGPFAVFQACEQATAKASSPSTSSLECMNDTIPFDVDILSNPAACHEAIDTLFPDLFPSLDGNASSSQNPELFIDDAITPDYAFASGAAPNSEPPSLRSACDIDLDWLSPSIPQIPDSQSRLTSEATFLLINYRDTVIAYLTPLHRRKTIWHVLYIPSAMTSVAALTLGDEPSSAQLTIFYAMLSISANCLSGESESRVAEYWRMKGYEYKVKAQQNLSCTLKELADCCKKAKYKEMLMALLVMVIVVTFAGDTKSASLFLYDADRLIRLKGLRKSNKSRKIRMLHHYYGFLRIFYESTSQQLTSPADQHYRCARPEPEDRIALEARRDHPFRLARWQISLDQKMQEEKSRERGENDLCLQEPGLWSSTMYSELFGVPESWLILLSQSIRLGNERELAGATSNDSTLSWQEFSTRAEVLEKCISSWSPPNARQGEHQDRNVETDATHDSTNDVVESMLSCLHPGLRIYFYRRIYNVDAIILQQQVSAIRQSLQRWTAPADKRLRYCAGFLWPALIGACEAIDPDDQDFYLEWFAGLSNDGFVTAQSAMTVINYVWQQRRDSNDNTISWTQYLSNHRMNLVFF